MTQQQTQAPRPPQAERPCWELTGWKLLAVRAAIMVIGMGVALRLGAGS